MTPNIGDLMKKAGQIQEEMKKAQEKLANAEVQGEAGAGLVKITMNGRHDVKRVNIDDSLMGGDREMLEDLLAAAVNDAVRKVEANNREMMSGMMSGMGAPGDFKMPF